MKMARESASKGPLVNLLLGFKTPSSLLSKNFGFINFDFIIENVYIFLFYF